MYESIIRIGIGSYETFVVGKLSLASSDNINTITCNWNTYTIDTTINLAHESYVTVTSLSQVPFV